MIAALEAQDTCLNGKSKALALLKVRAHINWDRVARMGPKNYHGRFKKRTCR